MNVPTVRRLWTAAAAGVLLIAVPIDGAAERHTRKVDVHLQRQLKGGSSTERVIVRLKPGRRAAVAQTLRQRGHAVYGDHPGIDALSSEISLDTLKALAKNPAVESISTDADLDTLDDKHTSKSKSPTSSTSSASSASFTTPVVSSLLTTLDLGNFALGSTIGVAVIDSGLQDDGNFTGRVTEFDDFTTSPPTLNTTPYDDYGHGTHVAGLVGSSGAISSGLYSGLAQSVRFVILKALDKNGKGKTSTLINAIEYVIANKDRLGIYVINLSLGHPIYESAATDPLVQEVERATRAGLIVVVAAGNNGRNPNTGMTGYAGITSPGNAPDAITVGAAKTFDTAIRSDDRIAGYSSRGPTWYDGFAKPDIVAPGQTLVSDAPANSTLTQTYPSLALTYKQHTYMRLSGTSMATGVVSGLVAAMLEVSRFGAVQRAITGYGGVYVSSDNWVRPPYPTVNAIKAMLQYSATPLHDDYGVPYDALTQGAGEINGFGALLLAYSTDTSKPVGSLWATTFLDPHTLYGTENVAWAQDIIWGTHVLTGLDVLTVNQQAWAQNIVWGTGDNKNLAWAASAGDNIVWGSNILAASNIVWSSNIVWGDDIVWGTNIVWGSDVVWGTNLIGFFDGLNVVWGSFDGDNIVWGSLDGDNIVWGSSSIDAYTYLSTVGSL
jgi:serine protease AprX